MPGFDWTTMQFAKGKETAKVPGQRVGLPPYKTRIPSVADGPAGLRIKSIREDNTYYATAFPVGTALLRLEYYFDQYRRKSDGK
jgi:hypothetical protein